MINTTKLESSLAQAAKYKEKNIITATQQMIKDELKFLDAWFNYFLQMFTSKLNSAKDDNPIKQLYENKTDYYKKVQRLYNLSNYYIQQV